MQLSNVLLLVVAVAAVILNPLTDRIAAGIAGFFRHVDRSIVHRRLRHVAPKATPCPNGCG
jgi:hypothetical protein